MSQAHVLDAHPGVEEILSMVSPDFGEWSTPILVTQYRINTFAAATGDDQWIHTDPARASVTYYKRTLAQGSLLISFIAVLRNSLLKSYEDRYPRCVFIHKGGSYVLGTPVREGDSIRIRGRVMDAVAKGLKTVNFVFAYEMAVIGSDKTAASGTIDIGGIFR
jgi:acyl dehydratase